ncbi:MAG: hypothetical protein GX456_20185, partial [Verrucomicrobia bacterium]|nr:hypothetical protein [Verrucomicrobiota bacterium]
MPSMICIGGSMVRRMPRNGELAGARKPRSFAKALAVGAALLGVLVGTPAGDASELYSFTNLNLGIPDGNWAGLSDSRDIVSSIGSVTKVRVKLHIAGEFNGDLYAYLRQIKDGRTNFCVLLNRPGRTSSNPYGYPDCGFDVTFDDDAANGDVHVYRNKVVPQPGTPLTSTWQPDGRNVDPAVVTDASARTTTLSSFNGTAGSGNWTLFIADLDLGATNMLLGWEIELSGPVAAPIVWATPADITYGTALGPSQLNASSTVQGTFAYDPPAGTVLPAGTHTLSVTFTPVDTVNYTPATKQVTIKVLKAPLTIKADNKSKVYGAALPALTASYSGFVNGDTPASLDTPVTLSTTATASSPVGTYTITASGASDANYTISFVNGTLTVTKAPLTITADNKSKVYGAALPTLTASYSGFVNGDTPASLDTPVTLSTTATASRPVGTYTITASGASDANYTISFVNGTLTVTKAALTIT